MKILHLCPYLYPAVTFGGPAQVVYDLAKEQSKQHQVTVVTSDAMTNVSRMLPTEFSKSQPSFTITYLPNWWYKNLFETKFFTHFGLVWWFLKHSRSFDIIHIHDVFVLPQLISAFIGIAFKKKIILSPHGVLDPTRMKSKSKIKWILFLICVKPILKASSLILATSPKTAHHLRSLTSKPVRVLFNGVYLPKTSADFQNPNTHFVYIGRLHPQKGLQELLEATNIVLKRSKTKKFNVTLAGPDDGILSELVQYSAANSLQKHVSFIGLVKGEKKQKLLRSATVFVYPSYAEGFSISILEAMSYGLPVLITRGCNFPKVESHKAGKIVTGNTLSAELATAMADLLEHPSQIQKMGQNARSLIESDFSINRMAEKSILLYQTLL